MTIISERATFCGECRKEADAYYAGMRAMWRQEFVSQHEREPTDEEMMTCAPSSFGPVMGANGYPGCPKCEGRGVYIVEEDGSITPGGILSAFVAGGGVPVSEAVITDECRCAACGAVWPVSVPPGHARWCRERPLEVVLDTLSGWAARGALAPEYNENLQETILAGPPADYIILDELGRAYDLLRERVDWPKRPLGNRTYAPLFFASHFPTHE